ncbi:MAG: Glycosyl transferase family 2 [Candidatus Daviesbacteria bacterium GW2011_GWA2_42_7]|uniref:Glycosyl transferase family 2 n=1 Tax=Candidatus Daviesbacteria bacterium GW2011_GWA2_42_7 TaxID=1618425 RepID=A0A0G1B8E7_9BACT|nr:MAG: Glycosyl transferase family 2 [Candidatus Daviesbacteria bacterium GW2011_GWA2_42_7]
MPGAVDKQKRISVFFPCYNDEGSIAKLVEDSFETLKTLTDDYEVIVVDDGSRDKSRQILSGLEKRYRNLKLVFHQKNQGYGGALKSGFKAATKDLIFYTDGDGQYDVKELPVLLSLMSDDVDFVNGIKMARRDATYRIVIGNMYSLVTRWIFMLPVYDVDCDFRLIRKTVLDKLDLESNSGSICVELVKKSQRAGAKFRQVSVHHFERQWGKSQFFRFSKLLSTFFEILRLWVEMVITSRAMRPRSKK